MSPADFPRGSPCPPEPDHDLGPSTCTIDTNDDLSLDDESAAPSSGPTLYRVPLEILEAICSHLTETDHVSLMQTSQWFHDPVKHALVFKATHKDNYPLYWAIQHNKLDLLHLALGVGAKIDGPSRDMIIIPRHLTDPRLVRDRVEHLRLASWPGNTAFAVIPDVEVSPLHIALLAGYNEIAKLLVDRGADLHAPGCEGLCPCCCKAMGRTHDWANMLPLHIAICRGNTEMAAYLIERGAPMQTVIRPYPLRRSLEIEPVTYPSETMSQPDVESDAADVDDEDAGGGSSDDGDSSDSGQQSEDEKDGDDDESVINLEPGVEFCHTAVHDAVERGNLEVLDVLISLRRDEIRVNTRDPLRGGFTAVHLLGMSRATTPVRRQILSRLTSLGVDVNATRMWHDRDSLQPRERRGQAPIMQAIVGLLSADMFSMLAGAGATIDGPFVCSALISMGDRVFSLPPVDPLVKEMVRHGVDFRRPNEFLRSTTPALFAAEQGRVHCMAVLFANGARIDDEPEGNVSTYEVLEDAVYEANRAIMAVPRLAPAYWPLRRVELLASNGARPCWHLLDPYLVQFHQVARSKTGQPYFEFGQPRILRHLMPPRTAPRFCYPSNLGKRSHGRRVEGVRRLWSALLPLGLRVEEPVPDVHPGHLTKALFARDWRFLLFLLPATTGANISPGRAVRFWDRAKVEASSRRDVLRETELMVRRVIIEWHF